MITAADFAAAKPSIKNGQYVGGTNLPGAFGQHFAPKPSPTTSTSGGGSGGGGGGTSSGGGSGGGGGGYVAPVDPYSPAQHAYLNTLAGAIDSIRQNSSDAFSSAGRTLQGGSEALYNKILTGQTAIDRSRENNQLNRLNGIQDVINFVRQGIQSGATRLANSNALESSAAGALTRAYSTIGNSKVRGVNNQAMLEGRNIDTTQENLDLQRKQGIIDLHRQRDEAVQNIGSQVRQQLTQLDQQGVGLGLTGKVAVEQEKQRVINAGMAKVNAADNWLKSHLSGVTAESPAAVAAAAAKLRTAGFNTGTTFDTGLGSVGVTGLDNTGAPISQLPLFTQPKKDNTQNSVLG